MADIPGLIEGAHEGAGIGDRFLGHVERCRAILHLIDVTSEDVARDYASVRGELAAYGGGLDEKEEIVALTKCDAVSEEHRDRCAAALSEAHGVEARRISAVTGLGMDDMLFRIADVIGRTKAGEKEAAQEDRDVRWQP